MNEAISQQDERVRLFNGKFVDVEAGRYHDPQVSVVLQGGRIIAMPGLAGEPDVPADRSIDLRGAAVIPGLFNTHLHLRLVNPSIFVTWSEVMAARRLKSRQVRRNLADCLRCGVTNVRDAWSANLAGNRKLKGEIARGEIAGPRIAVAVLVGPLGGAGTPRQGMVARAVARLAGFSAPPYHDPMAGEVAFRPEADEREVRDAVDRAVDERGAEAIKLYDQRETAVTYRPGATLMTQGQLDAATDQAHRRGVRTILHHATVETFRRGVRAGVQSMVHVPCDGDLTEADAAAFVAAGCILEPTLSLAYDLDFDMPGVPGANPGRLRRLGAIRAETCRDLAERFWLPGLSEAVIAAPGRAARGRTNLLGVLDVGPALRYWAGVVSCGMDNVNRILARGGQLACGNDAGAVARTPAMVGLELKMIGFCRTEAGASWTGAEALRIATLQGARSMGMDDRFGTIAPGKVADLAVLRGDPLADPEVIGSPVDALFLDGRLVEL